MARPWDFYLNNRERFSYTPNSVSSSFNIHGTDYEYTYGNDHIDTHRLLYSGVVDENVNKENSLYSDKTDSILYSQVNAGASMGVGGMKVNAGAGASLSKHRVDDFDIHLGQATASGGASIGQMEGYIGATLELNAISIENKNVQARLGLNASTGVSVSRTDVSVSVSGVGFNAGLNGIGINTPIGGFNLKFW